jgi:hypothetical protein
VSEISTVIEDKDGDTIEVETQLGHVFVTINQAGVEATVDLTVDQCAALIAAITDAAKVVTGEKA